MAKTNKKTIGQIEHKVAHLKDHLREKEVVENFGEREQKTLNKFVGDIYNYPYLQRQKISEITGNFFEWCISYNGKSTSPKTKIKQN